MKHVDTKIEFTCDLCGEKCVPIHNLEIVHSSIGDCSNTIRLDISAHIPYGVAEGDVCKTCLIAALHREFKL